MNNGMKYISYDRPYSYRAIVVFPADIDHSNMAIMLGVEDNIVGAGFVDINEDFAPRCYGKSTSLNKSADPGDTDLLVDQLLR